MKKHLLITIILALFTVMSAFSQTETESATVYFRVGKQQFEPTLANNARVIDDFIARLLQADTSVDTIIVRAYASPEGLSKTNLRLAEGRCDAIISYLVNAGIPRNLIRREPGGIAWGELRQAVESAPGLPNRAQVIEILDNTPEWVYDSKGRIIDGRKRQLMNLAGGRPFRWMLDNIFPDLRKGVALTAYLSDKSDESDKSDRSDESDTEPKGPIADLIAEADSLEALKKKPVEPVEADEPADDYTPRHRMALKSNLLYYAALMPNLELEWLINDHWSVLLEGNIAWWSKQSENKCYQLAHFGPEARYWINPKGPWHGMFAGVFVSGGLYDLQNGGNGVQGHGVMTGLSFGYMWPIARNWSMEASIGAGYMYTRYKEYEPRDGHYLYLRTKDLNYFGPLKAKLSIAWRFWDINKRKPNLSAI